MKEYIITDIIGNLKVIAPDESCLFCKHCTDFFWDYTHGPYLFFCDVYDVAVDDCERFEEEIDA